MDYRAPINDMLFLIRDVLELSDDMAGAVLSEAAKFAEQELDPINKIGDSQGAKLKDGVVTMPDGFKKAYSHFVSNGWGSIAFNPEYGGQGLPHLVSIAVSEMWNSANMAFTLCPLLTQSAVELLEAHGTDEQKSTYLPKMISGEWTGSMCLTEPQAGSDLGAITTTAKKTEDGHYLIKGQKIFITYGEHDLAENIIHMVLARTEDAPRGSKGISLFLVPKILQDGSRNDVAAVSLEHKMGIHASPTAVMALGEKDECVGYMVGEENRGLIAMFTMMNHARIAVGVEGLGIAERAYQMAKAYAEERVQGGWVIAKHPDVHRMLMTMRANTEAMRALVYFVANAMDRGDDSLVALLTPVVKAHATDIGFETASLAVQVFGGMGYIEETGVAQLLRDARIAMIYEGTNGIQAKDLVERKLIIDDGFEKFIAEAEKVNDPEIKEAIIILKDVTEVMRKRVKEDLEAAQSVATPYLRLFAVVAAGAVLTFCKDKLKENDKFAQEKLQVIDFYKKNILPEISYLQRVVL